MHSLPSNNSLFLISLTLPKKGKLERDGMGKFCLFYIFRFRFQKVIGSPNMRLVRETPTMHGCMSSSSNEGCEYSKKEIGYVRCGCSYVIGERSEFLISNFR